MFQLILEGGALVPEEFSESCIVVLWVVVDEVLVEEFVVAVVRTVVAVNVVVDDSSSE
jgi:hypothetical protein